MAWSVSDSITKRAREHLYFKEYFYYRKIHIYKIISPMFVFFPPIWHVFLFQHIGPSSVGFLTYLWFFPVNRKCT